MAHTVRITYCTQCRWLPRAAWLAQELLGTFEAELAEVALAPGRGGVFTVSVNGETVWDRAKDSLEVEFDPEPFEEDAQGRPVRRSRVTVGADVWIPIGGAGAVKPSR